MKRKSIGLAILIAVVVAGFLLYCVVAGQGDRVAVKQVEQTGGYVKFVYYGPHWLTRLFGDSYPCKSAFIVEMGMQATDADLSSIKPLSKAKMLFLNGTHIEGPGLTNLLGWSSLQEIELTKSSITDEGMRSLAVFPQVKRLTLVGTKITDVGIAYLEKLNELQELSLQNTKVTDHCLQYLVGLPLKELDVKGTLITSNGIAYLKKNNPSVDIVQ
jgi:Leucine Rich repeat